MQDATIKMGENTGLVGGENTGSNLREIPEDGLKDFFKEIEVGTIETGYRVPLIRKASIRSLMSNIAAYTDKVFESEKIKNGSGDIIIWRKS
jgi:hypothetical protein